MTATLDDIIGAAGLGDTLLSIKLPFPAEACGRARMSRGGHMYTPAKTRTYQARVTEYCRKALNDSGLAVLVCPCCVDIVATFSVPKSWPAAKRQLALAGYIHPRKGDWDNIAKSICDAMNGVVYYDDRLVQSGSVKVQYGNADEVSVVITKMGLTDYELQAATEAARTIRSSNRPGGGRTPVGGDGRTCVSVQPGQKSPRRKRASKGNHRRNNNPTVVQPH